MRKIGLEKCFSVIGRPCCMVFATRDKDGKPSQEYRALFLQEMIKRGILAPSFIISYSHSDQDVDRTIEAVHQSLAVYKRALKREIGKYLIGAPVKTGFSSIQLVCGWLKRFLNSYLTAFPSRAGI